MGRAPARDYSLTTIQPRKKLACGFPGCPKAFGRKGDLKRHELLHRGIKNHRCDLCKKMFSQNSGLKTHLNTHTGEKPYRCLYQGCEAEFGDPSSHARHRKETHQVNYHYKCPVESCISTIKRRSAFAAHLKAKHNIVTTSKQLDSLRICFKPAPSQRRKAGQTDHNCAPVLAIAEIIDQIHLNPSVTTPHLSTTTKVEKISPARDIINQQRPEGSQFYFHSDRSHQTDIQSLFSTPMLSSSTTSSAFSAQSSTETLIDDFKYEDYTHTKMFYADVADRIQNINPAVDLMPSSSPAPMALPFAEDAYRTSSSLLHPGPQDYIRMNAQIAYDRQRYVLNMNASPYPLSHKSYTVSQAQEKDFYYSDPQQSPSQSWQPWFS